MSTPAVSNGPVEYTDRSGHKVQIPLTAISFDSSGKATSTWPQIANYTSDEQGVIQAWLDYLTAAQLLTPAPAATQKPAMLVRAADPGSSGNNVSVVVGNVSANNDPTQTTFEVTVSENDAIKGLSTVAASPQNVKVVLGTEATAGTRPGLVHVIDASVVPGGVPQNGPVTFSAPAAGQKATADVKDSGAAVVFTLECRHPDDHNTKVTIANANTTAKTFDLTATWSSDVTGVTMLNAATKLADSGYLVTVSTPGGGAFSTPAAGTTGLSGGSDGSSPTTASAVLYAG